ncbi:MAG: hypothetical protein ACI841_003277 [Planctomycetota bacterium]|jgi:hypothetical protein
MAKYAQRLDYARLAEVLHERDMVDSASLGELLQTSAEGGTPFPVALVSAKLVGDWDLSRIVCEIFNLPFLPIDVAIPDLDAAAGLDEEFLVKNGLVPIGRFGQTLTISMPGIVPADVLGLMSAMADLVILPTVGTVHTNRRWLEDNLAKAPAAALPAKVKGSGNKADWRNLFDDADAAVQSELGDDIPPEELEELVGLVEADIADIDELEAALDLSTLEVAAASLEDYELDEALDTLSDAASDSSSSTDSGGSLHDLPPSPDFG